MLHLGKSIGTSVVILAVGLFTGLAGFAQPGLEQLTPEIKLPNQLGDTVVLSSLRGKMVLVDFWASWCGPCRVANKRIRQIYEKYRGAGFEIYAVSLDDDQKAWKKAISADKITWIQVNQKGGWDSPVAKKWGIEQLPTSFLLDPEGKVLAIDPSYELLSQLLAAYHK